MRKEQVKEKQKLKLLSLLG